MDPQTRQEVIDALGAQREGSLAAFFTAHGLADAFESPGRGWGREKKIAAALAAARKEGRELEVLHAAATRYLPEASTDASGRPKVDVAQAAESAASAQVFISHVGTEREMALALKAALQAAFPGLDVFVSSDPGSISPGERWVDLITRALKDCSMQIVIASPASVSRPWINFEAGAEWIRSVPVIPLCHSGMTPAVLPLPLTLLQAGILTLEADLENCFAAVARITGRTRQQVDLEFLAHELGAIESRYLSEGVSTLSAPSAPVANRPVPELRALRGSGGT